MASPHVKAEKHEGLGLSQPPHSLTYTAVLEELSTDADDGLVSNEARARLETFGYNRLEEEEGLSIWKILLRQIANAMMLVSVGSMVGFISLHPTFGNPDSDLIPPAGTDFSHGRQLRHSVLD